MRILYALLILIANLHAQSYEMGHGIKIHDKLRLGGYLSTDYKISDTQKRLRLDDVAVLAYGNLTPEASYLIEMEAAPFFTRDFKKKSQEYLRKFHYERIYADYKLSENANFRIGKQITPIGYWNLEPINVLRETSSNPLFSSEMFPKFVTGLDIYGYVPNFENTTYHLFGQSTKDIDTDYINIANKHFYALAFENEASMEFQFGGSIGQFIDNLSKRTRFLQANAKYEMGKYAYQAEVAINNIRDGSKIDYKFAAYLQGHYSINIQHAIIARYEYFDDGTINQSSHIGVLGYSYRPIYPVSLKAEYQLNSDEKLNNFLLSLSVLF